MSFSEEFIKAIVILDEAKALELAKKRLDESGDPLELLSAIRIATDEIGQKFEDGEYFVADLVMTGEILKKLTKLIRPKLAGVQRVTLGKFLIGTVEGDIHDIGKNIVITMLESAGFEVTDLGIDVPPSAFVKAIQQYNPDIVGMSGLLTVAIESMKTTFEAIEAAGLREKVKIIIGGGRLDEHAKEYIGADAWTNNVATGIKLCKQLLGKT